ncbi:ABC transporter permease [Numidum massiliense]|uniref:ABC transporter permease n=1 Tax=Numidum massiliense TaxID=1522315 RepID=UPI0006D5400F|nr:ABC transporter permease [Numidum massiliense]
MAELEKSMGPANPNLFAIMFKRDLFNLLTDGGLLIYHTLFPLLLIMTLGYLGSGIYGGSGVTAYDYYSVTIMIYSALNVSITAANSFMENNLKRSNLRVLYAPVPKSFVYLSKIAAAFLFTSVCSVALVLLLQTVFGLALGGSNVIYTIAVLLGLHLFSASLGVLLCCVFKSEEMTNKILSMVNNVLAILGGLFFQLDSLGRWAENISYLSPAKWVAETVLRIVYDDDFSFFLPTMATFVVASLLILWGCKRTFKTEDYV